MQITVDSTDRVVDIVTSRGMVPARVWEGRTAKGVPVAVLITRVAAHLDHDRAEFEEDLNETRAPSDAAVNAFPSRLLL